MFQKRTRLVGMARTTTVSMEALLKPTFVNSRKGGMVVGNGSSLRRLPPVLSAALVGVPGRRINAAGLLFHRTGRVVVWPMSEDAR